MAERRFEDAVYYDHMGSPCRDSDFHRRCSGRWRGEINLGKDGSGERQRVKVSARNKTEVYQKLRDKRRESGEGVRTSGKDRYGGLGVTVHLGRAIQSRDHSHLQAC